MAEPPTLDLPSDETIPPETSSPLPLSASIILSDLPPSTTAALDGALQSDTKVRVRFRPLASAPALTQDTFKISASNRFESVIAFLRKQLRLKDESVVCYVGQVFAPGLDESVGGLFSCFKNGKNLDVHYSLMPVYG